MSMVWDELLPTRVEVNGVSYEIRSDYRAILDICTALSDPELSDNEKAFVALRIFYPDFVKIPSDEYQDALDKCFWFIDCGKEKKSEKNPKLVDWEQDFQYIVAPINKVVGKEIRSLEYMHWWTFIAAYQEIGDCTFAQIVRIRDKKARGKRLDKSEQEWYRKNKDLVDFKMKYTEADNDLLKEWGSK